MEQQKLNKKIKRFPQDRIADSLSRQPGPDRATLHQALREYAIEHAGTNADLDPDLEAAAIDQLLQSD